MKILKIIMGVVGVLLIIGFFLGGGISNVLSFDPNSTDARAMGFAIGSAFPLLIGIAFVYYGFFKRKKTV